MAVHAVARGNCRLPHQSDVRALRCSDGGLDLPGRSAYPTRGEISPALRNRRLTHTSLLCTPVVTGSHQRGLCSVGAFFGPRNLAACALALRRRRPLPLAGRTRLGCWVGQPPDASVSGACISLSSLAPTPALATGPGASPRPCAVPGGAWRICLLALGGCPKTTGELGRSARVEPLCVDGHCQAVPAIRFWAPTGDDARAAGQLGRSAGRPIRMVGIGTGGSGHLDLVGVRSRLCPFFACLGAAGRNLRLLLQRG